jgi:hypothetical protein
LLIAPRAAFLGPGKHSPIALRYIRVALFGGYWRAEKCTRDRHLDAERADPFAGLLAHGVAVIEETLAKALLQEALDSEPVHYGRKDIGTSKASGQPLRRQVGRSCEQVAQRSASEVRAGKADNVREALCGLRPALKRQSIKSPLPVVFGNSASVSGVTLNTASGLPVI